jgi:hypothetical protein
MFAILYAFLLWHESWRAGLVRLACDNMSVMDAINKRSIKGETVHPLQSILLIAAIFDIDLFAFWIPSEENIVADAASRLQVSHHSPAPSMSTLRRKLKSCFITPSHPQHEDIMTPSVVPMNPSVTQRDTSPFQSLYDLLHIGSPKSCPSSNLQQSKATLMSSAPSTSIVASPLQSSTTPVLPASSRVVNDYMGKGSSASDFPSHLPSYSGSLMNSKTSMKLMSMSERPSVWHLPPSFDMENLRGIHGPHNIMNSISHVNMSNSIMIPTP